MKLLLDNKQQLSNIFKEKNIGNAAVINTAADVFVNYLKNKDDVNVLIDNIKTKNIKSVNDIVNQYNELVDLVKNNVEIQKLFKEEFLFNLKDLKKTNELQLQKVTYKISENENFDKIVEALKKQQSYAILKAIKADKDKRTITVYSSTYGLWNVAGELHFKNIEALSRQQNKIRAIFTLRKLKNVNELQDLTRLNFAIYEDVKTLFDNKAIETFYKSMQDLTGKWKDDAVSYFVKDIHFKEQLEEQDKLKEEAKESIKQQTTHKNKAQATLAQMQQTIDKNKDEIHTTYNINLDTEKIDEIEEEKNNILKSYEERLLKELEEKQKRELEELKLKIELAQQQREEAKKLYLKSLSNGNTITEAIDNLRAAKYNDIVVNEVLEDVKSDVLLSVKKDEIIANTKNELDKTVKNLEVINKKLEASEQARETNYKRYLEEMQKRNES